MAKIALYIVFVLLIFIRPAMSQQSVGPEYTTKKVKEKFDSDSNSYYFDIFGKLILEIHKEKLMYEESEWSTKYLYNLDGNVVNECTILHYKGPDSTYTDSTAITYLYDNGNLIREITEVLGLHSSLDTTAYYKYDSQDNLIEHIRKEGQFVEKETYLYNERNLVDTFKRYDNSGVKYGYGSIILDTLYLMETLIYTYDSDRRLISESTPTATTSKFINQQTFKKYTYDIHGNISQIHECLGQLGNCAVDNFITYENTYFEYRRLHLVKTITERLVDDKVISRKKEKLKFNKAGLIKKHVFIVYERLGNRFFIFVDRDTVSYRYTYFN